MVSGAPARKAAPSVYNLERFQRDGAPSSVASLAGGAAPPDHGDRLRGHMSLFGAVDNALGAPPAHASASAAANPATGYGQNKKA